MGRAYSRSGRAECVLSYSQKRWSERMISKGRIVGRIRKRILKKRRNVD